MERASKINQINYLLVLACLILVSFGFSVTRYHPFEAIKQVFLHSTVFLAALCLFASQGFRDSFRIRNRPLGILVLLYLTWSSLSFVLFRYTDRMYIINLLVLCLLFFVTAKVFESGPRVRTFLYVTAFLVTVSSLYSFLQWMEIDYALFLKVFDTRALGRRVFSFFGNPNFYAAFLIVNLPWLLTAIYTEKKRARIFFAVALVLGVTSLLLTGTRAGLLAACMTLPLFFGLCYGRPGPKRYGFLVSSTLALSAAGGLLVAFLPRPDISNLAVRQYWWELALKIFQDFPWFGSGLGSFMTFAPYYRSRAYEFSINLKRHELILDHPHNEFLEILSDLGLVGLLLFLGVLGAFFYRYYRDWDEEKKYLYAGSTCAVLAILIQNLFSVSLRYPFIAMFFWFNLGLQAALLPGPAAREKAVGALQRLLLVCPAALFGFILVTHTFPVYTAEYYMREAKGYLEVENYKMAEEKLSRVLENYPLEKSALYLLGISQYRQEKFAETRSTLRELVALDPNYLQTHYWLGSALYNLGDYNGAEEEYWEALRVNDAYGPAYFALGIVYLTRGQNQAAVRFLEQAVEMETDETSRDIPERAAKLLIDALRDLGETEKVELYQARLKELQAKRDR